MFFSSVFSSHSSEVCGLKWSPDEHFLTSGGSDCLVHVWEKTQLSNFNAVFFQFLFMKKILFNFLASTLSI